MRRLTTIGLVCAAALAAAGCSSVPLLDADTYKNAFTRTPDVFAVPEWATSSRADNVKLGPSGPVAPDDLVTADGRCSVPAEAAQAWAPRAETTATASADRPVGSVAGDLAGAPLPRGQQQVASAPLPDRLEPATPGVFTPTIAGGVALAMSECEVVRRAGQPNNVVIGADAKGERKVTLTYLGGTWPGIYHFQSGRLKEIEAAPEPPKPAKPAPRKKTPTKRAPQAAGSPRVYVQ